MEREGTWLAELTGPQRNHLSEEYVSSHVKQSSFVPKLAGPPCTDAIFSFDFIQWYVPFLDVVSKHTQTSDQILISLLDDGPR